MLTTGATDILRSIWRQSKHLKSVYANCLTLSTDQLSSRTLFRWSDNFLTQQQGCQLFCSNSSKKKTKTWLLPWLAHSSWRSESFYRMKLFRGLTKKSLRFSSKKLGPTKENNNCSCSVLRNCYLLSLRRNISKFALIGSGLAVLSCKVKTLICLWLTIKSTSFWNNTSPAFILAMMRSMLSETKCCIRMLKQVR